MSKPSISKSVLLVSTVAMILALSVVMLGAYTRLSNAGLGCPDWPGCYGHMVLPSAKQALQNAQQTFPMIPIEARKAWTEMAHRYAAGTLALLIIGLAANALRKQKDRSPKTLPVLLFFLVVFQAVLGMWTVTMKLLPVVVMGHLLGGMFIFSCLCLLRLQYSKTKPVHLPVWHALAIPGFIIITLQIALGGWVSANYAGIACSGFPQCNGQWLPAWHLSQGFHVLSPVGANYQGGVLDNDARISIQMVHRLGALITTLYILPLAVCLLLRVKQRALRLVASLLIVLILVQISLGIFNVKFLLPVAVAVAHNGVAALLMATMLGLVYLTSGRPSLKDAQ